MSGQGITGLLASYRGIPLGQAGYQRDSGERIWLAGHADSWKIERMQAYDETGFPSWEAFVAGDWAACSAPGKSRSSRSTGRSLSLSP